MASRFQWTDSGAQSFITKIHTQHQVPTEFYATFPGRALDGSVLEVVTVGSGVKGIDVAVRHETDHASLVSLRSAALRGLEFTYTPDNDTPGTTFTVKSVRTGDIGLEGEGRQNLFSLTLRLARLDGGAFGPDLP